MRVTEKGQVTIPKPIRDKLGIGPGSEVDFVEKGDGVSLVNVERSREERIEAMRQHFSQFHGQNLFNGMDGKTYVDWLRGPRNDVDPD
ncbi:AbrB/MazE/SpoVT family DNA-binding domain-containing protein [Fulvimarina sp. MAC8]|uniref:AbrB/MazE/SpoVT family DNA-binding domain-containing protein n=1 Tax=Fulvimarina sp. MAC8 TaxID=3162874 RepID=UPI0032ED9B90